MKTHKIIGIAFIVLSVIFVIVGYFVLPDVLVMQITIDGGAGTTMNKILGLLLMLGLGVIAGVYSIANKEKNYRNYLIMVILLIVFVMTFIFNL